MNPHIVTIQKAAAYTGSFERFTYVQLEEMRLRLLRALVNVVCDPADQKAAQSMLLRLTGRMFDIRRAAWETSVATGTRYAFA